MANKEAMDERPPLNKMAEVSSISKVGTKATEAKFPHNSEPRFPLGCPVWVLRYDNELLSTCWIHSKLMEATVLQVEEAEGDIQDGKRLYTVQVNDKNDNDNTATTSMMVPENELQFARFTPVWMLHNNNAQYEKGLIVGSDHLPQYVNNPHNKEHYGSTTLPNLTYSVHSTTTGKIHHWIRPDNLVYRSSGDYRQELELLGRVKEAVLATENTEKMVDNSTSVSVSTSVASQKDPTNDEATTACVSTDNSQASEDKTVSSSSSTPSGFISEGSKFGSADPTKKIPPRAAATSPSSTTKNVPHQSAGIPKKIHRPAGPSRSFSYDQSHEKNRRPCSFVAPPQRPPLPPPPPQKNNVVINPFPNPFQYITVGENHQRNPALKQLRAWRKAQGLGYTVGEAIVGRCLMWHLRGECCSKTCWRAKDHVRLSPHQAKVLEESLLPVIGPQGPIYGRSPALRQRNQEQPVPAPPVHQGPIYGRPNLQEQHVTAPAIAEIQHDRYSGPTLLKREELIVENPGTDAGTATAGRYTMNDSSVGDWPRKNRSFDFNNHPKRGQQGMGSCFGGNNREWKKQRRH